MGNILLVGVGVFIALMVGIGIKRGMIKMAFSLVSMIVVIILVNVLTPPTKELLKQTPIYTQINESIEAYVEDNMKSATEELTETGVNAQKQIINGLPLPNYITESLIENNNEEQYEALEVSTFAEYIAASLSNTVLSVVTYILLFIVISILIRVLIHVLDIIAKLPLLRTFNMAGGAVIGFVEGILIVWLACIIVTAFSTTAWGQATCQAIRDNGMLSFIYDNNVLQNMISGIF